MAKRLSGRQALELIFADESNPEDSESSDEENWSSGSECQLESDGSDQQEDPKKVTMSTWKTAKQLNLTMMTMTYCTALPIQTWDMILRKTGVQLVTVSFPKVRWRSGRPVHQLRVRLELKMS